MDNINIFHICVDERVTRDSSVFPVKELCYTGSLKCMFEKGGGRKQTI